MTVLNDKLLLAKIITLYRGGGAKNGPIPG